MFKIITGEPRSGKTLFCVRELILKNYEWDKNFLEWKLKKDIEPFSLFTNVDGLKLPHINFDDYLESNRLTASQFFTLDHFCNVLLPKHGRVLVLIDEAHGYFPNNFKDPGAGEKDFSTFYFFGYHGHFPIDIYFVTHHWLDLPQSLTHKCEYQIDAKKRTMSAVGEFTYNFMDGMDVVHTERFMPDKKLFMLYNSTSQKVGEFHSKQIRPLRKWALIVAAIFITMGGGILYFVTNFKVYDDSVTSGKNEVKGGAAPGGGAGRPLPALVGSPVLGSSTKGAGAGLRRERTTSGLIPPDVIPQKYVSVAVGGAWIGGRLTAIDLFGDVIPVGEFPFSFTADSDKHIVTVLLPDQLLGSLRPGLWVDNSRIIAKTEIDEENYLGEDRETERTKNQEFIDRKKTKIVK